jgi:hypothetical protein
MTTPVSVIAGKTLMANKGMTSKEAGRYDPVRGRRCKCIVWFVGLG